MSQPKQPEQPTIVTTQTEHYRENYANSVQVRMSVWDFFLVFGTMQQESSEELPGHLRQPAAGQGAAQHP